MSKTGFYNISNFTLKHHKYNTKKSCRYIALKNFECVDKNILKKIQDSELYSSKF